MAVVAALAACGGSDDDSLGSLQGGEIDWVDPSTAPESESEDGGEDAADSEPVEQSLTPAETSNPDAVQAIYRIAIPEIGVAAPVVPIASEDRVLLPPRDPGVVGWWSEGAAPGDDRGTAILTGHSVSAGGRGALQEIRQLSVGDSIELSNGLTYQVDSVEVLSYDDVAAQAETLFDQTVPGRLVLVTCEGWDGSTWTSNVITIATPA